MKLVKPCKITGNMIAMLDDFNIPVDAMLIKVSQSQDAVLVLVVNSNHKHILMYQFLNDNGNVIVQTGKVDDLEKMDTFLLHLKAVENRSLGNTTIKEELKILKLNGCG